MPPSRWGTSQPTPRETAAPIRGVPRKVLPWLLSGPAFGTASLIDLSESEPRWSESLLAHYFVATFTPLRPFASIAFCTTPVCFASSMSIASRACAEGERPFGSAAATGAVPNTPGTILALGQAPPAAQGIQRLCPRQRHSPCRSAEGPLHQPQWSRLRGIRTISAAFDFPRQHTVGRSATNRTNLYTWLVNGGYIGKFCSRRARCRDSRCTACSRYGLCAASSAPGGHSRRHVGSVSGAAER